MENRILGATAFVARCSGAATVAYELASVAGLPSPLWAAVSAVIVSQERLHETRSSLTGRILGTLLGIAVTIAVSELASRAAPSVALRMAVSVAICAAIARRFPRMRVAMWTCPILLLAAQPSAPILMIALRRGAEVIMGALVGWALHWSAEVVVEAISRGRARDTPVDGALECSAAETDPG